MLAPFIYVSEPDATHYEECGTSNGVIYAPRQGTHAFFVARVPFIPFFLSPEFLRGLPDTESGRVALITKRQMRFVGDLLTTGTLANNAVALDLRFIVQPGEEGRQNRIEIVFVGRAFHTNSQEAKQLCLKLWRKFSSHYPSEDAFNYPLEPVGEKEIQAYLFPISPKDLTRQLREIRKYEDFDPLVADEASAVGYFPHPYTPAFDVTGSARFMQTLAEQQERCVVSIGLKRTALFPEEQRAIDQYMANYQRKANEAQGWLQLYRSKRFEEIYQAYSPLINARQHLFKLKIQVFGEEEAPDDVLESLGSELTTTALADRPRHWACEAPENITDALTAYHNFLHLEHRHWGSERVNGPMRRLRCLATVAEAAGPFRLPIPPEGGYLAGIEVRDEPFVRPQTPSKLSGRVVPAGEIMHRGMPTDELFFLSVDELVMHMLSGGRPGIGKSNTYEHILAQLWKRHRIPWLVIYPIDKPDYRHFMADPEIRDDLLIFTIGDQTVSPLALNPFTVAEGVLVRTHMSLLMRCFSSALWLWSPLDDIYREAIRQVYLRNGWDVENGVGGTPGLRTPTMADFYETLVEVSHEMSKDFGEEVKGNIRQGAEIRIRGLLSNLGSVINASEPTPIAEILRGPGVVEVGRIGSQEDTALVMAFLLMLISEQLQSNMRQRTHSNETTQIHITLIEEAHKVMTAAPPSGGEFTANPRAKGSEDWSHLLAEVRGLGAGIFIAEQMPADLVRGAIGNTHIKLFHQMEDPASFTLFCDLLNLNERQRTYARTLPRGHVLVRDHKGHPVHIRVPHYLGELQAKGMIINTSDDAVREFMNGRFRVPMVSAWRPPQNSMSPNSIVSTTVIRTLLECYSKDPEYEPIFKLTNEELQKQLNKIGTASDRQDWLQVRSICAAQLEDHGINPDARHAYCLFIRIAMLRLTVGMHSGKLIYEAFPSCREALEQFPI